MIQVLSPTAARPTDPLQIGEGSRPCKINKQEVKLVRDGVGLDDRRILTALRRVRALTRGMRRTDPRQAGRTRKCCRGPACSILRRKYQPMAPRNRERRTLNSSWCWIPDLSRTLLIRGSGFLDIYLPEGALCALAGIGSRGYLEELNARYRRMRRARVSGIVASKALFFWRRTTRI